MAACVCVWKGEPGGPLVLLTEPRAFALICSEHCLKRNIGADRPVAVKLLSQCKHKSKWQTVAERVGQHPLLGCHIATNIPQGDEFPHHAPLHHSLSFSFSSLSFLGRTLLWLCCYTSPRLHRSFAIMSKSAYAQFLAAPSAALLTDDASLLYITTLTTIHEPGPIIKNLSSKELTRKEQKILTAVEDTTNHTLAVEVETTLQFLSSGGAYLPRLDDNFLADRIVSLPIVGRPADSSSAVD